MIVVNRFRVPLDRAEEFRAQLQAAYETLAAQRGFEQGGVGRNLDDPELWMVHTQWRDVGSYRRALSAYDVKLTAVPVLSMAVDEPSAYEPVVPGAVLNDQQARSLG
ncbi:antibiotic biosynthesis monooxygenase family protein [Nocardioides jishulii]|uniref:Antibiotic biosynthesis monooxygenase n=1 Tax=Nocardioides jishulii TaxID=2575440 RepID=A0A4U2YJR9_9ACTN|nr:antibiotic biosynthesis monooxygenase family protein [Nocardioides jishulii]QCX27959.1 antibiotic biosynthesis monooxygenase [Nocardioides jishulii]TKI60622.1 antibiotic biosynthesis monooxygenase [Nocardioides jishulii]